MTEPETAALARLFALPPSVRWELYHLVGFPGPRYKLLMYHPMKANIVHALCQDEDLATAITKALDQYEGQA